MSLVVRYPREIPAGSTNGDLILNLDLPETFLNYAGAPLPGHMPGRRARAALAGQAPADWRTSMYYRYWMHEMRPAHYGIRTGHYKLIFFYGRDVLGQTRAQAGNSMTWSRTHTTPTTSTTTRLTPRSLAN